ncbi:hypothetical protein GIB67_030367 [Kingdonia uniflora]|uniref:Rab-GAP TBC domain-containing protein n=1 Tax=Kingdonia uniflora TaxID=39325 RepID=A0A7J7M6R9_9MAGN|nr:hypothetical protein GIB67_030367 [Kingdonia uniflora]
MSFIKPIFKGGLRVYEFCRNRDSYGFAVRPQHLQRYREYATIYKEEEEERSDRWKDFLERQAESAHVVEGEEIPTVKEIPQGDPQIWAPVRLSLGAIEHMMSHQIKRMKDVKNAGIGNHLSTVDEDVARPSRGIHEDDSEEEFYDLERSDSFQDTSSTDSVNDGVSRESLFPWKEELECLVQGGVPMALRGELWQAFVGVRACRVENYYQDLLASETNIDSDKDLDSSLSNNKSKGSSTDQEREPENWKGQIEKVIRCMDFVFILEFSFVYSQDLPRTFPGHPALDEDGRNALRRLLTAYARHNPSVGYCQAMNFFAGLLLLLMPEENAFWTLTGIIDYYFDGYYSEEMIESQVDQLVFEELVRERFPKLVKHLDYLGVTVAWVTGPWFLSIFVNMLPWETVLRVWDVLLFEGNRLVLFRTALALLELYGPALVTTKDAGDAITLLQSLAGSTFDSSQLVLTACMGYQAINEARLCELRDKHRPSVIAASDERFKGLRVSQGLASKLHNEDDVLHSISEGASVHSPPGLTEQVMCLRVELCNLLEENRSAILRADELETALMEMVKQDNRRQLSVKVEVLEQEVADLRQALADKQEQERAVIQVLMRVEQEQRITEDARRFAEQDAASQRHNAHVLQGKYDDVLASIALMEKRVVMAESMLEATLHYQSAQVKAQESPRSPRVETSPIRVNQEIEQDLPTKKFSLLSKSFGLGHRDSLMDNPSTVL